MVDVICRVWEQGVSTKVFLLLAIPYMVNGIISWAAIIAVELIGVKTGVLGWYYEKVVDYH